MRKLTIEFVRDSFEAEGYTLLTKKCEGAFQKLEYVCPKGDIGTIRWNDWQQGHRCAECASVKKLTIEFIRKEFEKERYTLLSKEYTGCAQELKYICPEGHYWDITWNDWRTGYRCQKCYFERIKGKNNHNYNPNLTDKERLNGRCIPGYGGWRKAVKEKDGFTCQACGDNKDGNLESHHLESYNNNPDLRIALDNGVCLCKKCHKDFHHQYGRGNNTRKQFEEFLLRRTLCE